MAFPKSDAALVPYSTNWNTRITASPATYGLSATQASGYTAVHDPYIDAVAAVQAALESGVRSRPLIATKNDARLALLKYGRELYAYVQANQSVPDAAKIELGVVVRDVEPTPQPAPGFAPGLEVVSVNGRIVRVRLSDPQNPTHRRLPDGVDGAIVMSHIGETAPSDPFQFSMQGALSKTTGTIVFPESATPGTKVWLAAVWFNGKKQLGPACAPISAHVGFDGAMPMVA